MPLHNPDDERFACSLYDLPGDYRDVLMPRVRVKECLAATIGCKDARFTATAEET